METIHLKTVDPTSQKLLRAAASGGIELNWERYERQQPQDGFLRVGLACPYGCMQGPCRIDPFGRGASTGVCGVERDGMAAAMVLRLAVNGALEAVNLAGEPGAFPAPMWPATLAKLADNAVAKLGGGTLTMAEIFSGAAALTHPCEPAPALVRRALRLGVLTLGLSGVRPSRAVGGKIPFKTGYGVLAGNQPTIGICGTPATAVVEAVSKAAGAQTRVVSLGMWLGGKALLPIACTSGEAELVISSGAIDAVVYGPDVGAVPALCAKLGIPAFTADDADGNKVVAAAAKAHGKRSFAADPAQLAVGEMLTSAAIADALGADKSKRLAVIAGPDTLQQPLGGLASELPRALAAGNCRIATWGDAALWMTKRGPSGDGAEPLVLDAARGPLDVLEATAMAGGVETLRGIAFTALRGTVDFATALGAAALGARVCVAQPLPLWGSVATREALADTVRECGGAFSHFDHPATADEIRAWFDER